MAMVRTAVFPIAGFGTRFLPATKAMPKVLLPVVDRPLIQYAVDEANAAGIESLVFVTGRDHSAVEDYFDVSYELERELVEKGKTDLAAMLEEMRPRPGQFAFVRQMEPLGLGHAVWCARNLIGNEPFAVLLADELIIGDDLPLSAMIDVHAVHGGNVVLVDDVDPSRTDRYGIIRPTHEHDGVIHVDDVVEKPSPADAPSNLAIIGRYILDPSVMDALSSTRPGAGGEIQLTDAIRQSISTMPLHAVRSAARRFDCGSPTGFLEATAHVAMQNPELAPTMRSIAREIVDAPDE
ncbi:MAG: UTP--glucose-1-phosphate uridylyltransferase [Acidimicrobiia bacterium]